MVVQMDPRKVDQPQPLPRFLLEDLEEGSPLLAFMTSDKSTRTKSTSVTRESDKELCEGIFDAATVVVCPRIAL